MDVKAPLPHDDDDANDDNASLTTSLPGLSPAPSIASTEAMDSHEPESDEPPPYSAAVAQPEPAHSSAPHVVATPDQGLSQWSARDPRSSSTHSLTPEHRSTTDGRRKLLLVYLHGFMGNEASFKSFPAHTHNLLCVLLAESHVVHTKIYPRYRSRRVIAAAAEDFSTWLTPHEGPTTDVVLLGHSMGGLVAAEVVLLPSHSTRQDSSPLRHRILGNLNFDVPFLGMHPGIISSGISSIFRSTPAPPQHSPAPSPGTSTTPPQSNLDLVPTSSHSSSIEKLPDDPNYNPMFPNDVRLAQRTGWRNAAHFINKHGRNLRHAAVQVVSQHIEFGSCMYDFEGLKTRYSRVRMLEEDNDKARATVVQASSAPPRVRFANYYTASTRRSKKPKKTPKDDKSEQASSETLSSSPDEEAPDSQPALAMMTEEDPIVYEEPAFLDTASLPPDYSDIDFTSESESGDLDDLDDLDPIDSTARTNTGLSDMSSDTTDTSSPTLELPKPQLPFPPVFKPPMKPPFNKEAYKSAVKTYKHEVHAYHRAIVAYHQEMQAYRKQEVRRIRMIRKKSMESIASSIDSRKQEYNQRRAELNDRLQKARESRKQLVEMLRPRAAKTEGSRGPSKCIEDMAAVHSQKVERKALKSASRDERKLARATDREDRKQARSERKALRKGRIGSLISGAGSVSSADDSQTLWDQDQLEKTSSASSSLQRPLSGDASSVVEPPPGPPPSPPPGPPPTRTAPPLPFRHPSASTTATSLATTATTASGEEPVVTDDKGKPKKDRKFCVLPPKSANGTRDPTWVRVYMEGVDEVGAHCGLFFPRGPNGNERSDTDLLEAGGVAEGSWSDRYAQFVGDVAERIEGWVLEDLTMRLVMMGEDGE